MHERYLDFVIALIWSAKNKLSLWQKSELAMLEAKANLKRIPRNVFRQIRDTLLVRPINLAWWYRRDKQIHHDLNAFLEERLRFLLKRLRRFFHEGMTSYDTEEAAFARMLLESVARVEELYPKIQTALRRLARLYRYTPMLARTHGQGAKVQSFGKRCLTWLAELNVFIETLNKAKENLRYSKMSGAIGTHGGIDPELEKEALRLLGFEPFFGATQIMPRSLYAPLAEALCQLVQTLEKIALDIRLGARSGLPLYHEPFAKVQKGSSAMPHKKNTILTEKIEGMARMAEGYLLTIMRNIKTWEERAIEQSCVERVAWPDLFHVTAHSLETMTKVLSGLVVYPDHMMEEIYQSRGCYASDPLKEWIKKKVERYGITAEDSYRMLQLACFNVFAVSEMIKRLRQELPQSLQIVDSYYDLYLGVREIPYVSIQTLIPEAKLEWCEELAISPWKVKQFNRALRKIFANSRNLREWNDEFSLAHQMRHEHVLFERLLGE